MKIVTKIIVTFLTITLIISSAPMLKSSADSIKPPKLNGGAQLMADHIHMARPISDHGFVSNYQLGQMIDDYYDGKSAISILNDVILFSGIGSPVGLINSLVTNLFVGGPSERLVEAYHTGKDMYWVAVYASGVEPSLTLEGYEFYSSVPIRFTD